MARKWVTGIVIVCALGLAGCMARNTVRNWVTGIVGGPVHGQGGRADRWAAAG